MTAAMYLRKSRAEEQEPVTETLSRHRDTLRQFAQEHSIVIEESYEEVVSGDSLFARPAMLRLLEEVSRYDAVLCMDIDRLGRGNMKEQGIILETLKRFDVKIITPRKTYDLNNDMDETYGEFQAFMARQELKLIKGRMQRGLLRSAEEGYHMGPPPYGYISRKNGKRTVLEVLPEESEIVRLMYKMYLEGSGVSRIALYLNELGLKPRKAARWLPVSVRRILSNDVYAGMATYGKLVKSKTPGVKKTFRPADQRITVPGLHTALVSPEDFAQVQAIMTTRYRPPAPDHNAIKNPMAGLIRCRMCGRALGIHHYKGQYYLLCKTKRCVRMTNMEYIEQAVLAEVCKRWPKVEAMVPSEPILPDTQTIRQSMEREIEKLRVRKDTLHDLLEQGVYTAGIYRERMARLQESIDALESGLHSGTIPDCPPREAVQITLPRTQRFEDVYISLSAREKNELLKAVVSKIVYAKAPHAAPKEFTVWVDFKE